MHLPIQGGGIHREQTGTGNANRYLGGVLEKRPGRLTARWLLTLSRMALGEYPDEIRASLRIPPAKFEAAEDIPQFHDVAATLGPNTISLSSGAIADDFDHDGWLDFVVPDWSPDGRLQYCRNGGHGTFSDRTAAAGLPGLFGGLNLIQAD